MFQRSCTQRNPQKKSQNEDEIETQKKDTYLQKKTTNYWWIKISTTI